MRQRPNVPLELAHHIAGRIVIGHHEHLPIGGARPADAQPLRGAPDDSRKVSGAAAELGASEIVLPNLVVPGVADGLACRLHAAARVHVLAVPAIRIVGHAAAACEVLKDDL